MFENAVRTGALLLLLVACSMPSEVSAAGSGNATPPAKESRPASSTGEEVEAQVLIWGGGRTPEEGRRALERFEAERSGLNAILSLGEGYPRVIASGTVPGLKPGFHVVLLGACKPEEAQEPLETLQSFKPGVYARTVKLALGPGSCPRHENGMGGAGTERLKEEPFELTAAAFIGEVTGPSSVPWIVRLYLRDEKGDLIGQTEVDPHDRMWDGTDRSSCRPSVEAAGTVMRVTVTCNTLAGGPTVKTRDVELKFQITAGKIEWLSSH
jgi:hypothetical protein